MMDLLFYVIIIVVIVLKLIFWIFYFYARNRRRQLSLALRQQSQQIPQGREFEEEPAVPQPAYVFTEYPFGLDDVPATFQIPPDYSEEDPVKRDDPPPPYVNDDDTQGLIENQEN
ncbi:hypothetical protein OS493_010068 [Desmophyllum pertusum]|uniref:Uncharacterized protein n=1 Tax=Desmophyllum pertusum TaxID=174260 RepID=A0A9W9YEF7_9CNID|nr:hypothetical protein OS493_010068 [Desmophyllum pertusum]